MDLDAAESRWRGAASDHERARAVGSLVRAAFVSARSTASGARPSGVSRAVARLAAVAVDAEVRAWLCERAVNEALNEHRSTWTLDVMVALAKMHPPAVGPALAMARTARDEVTPEAVVWTQERSAALASLSCLVEPASRRALVDEALSVARATRVHDRNDRVVVNAAPGLIARDPEELFAIVDSVALGDPAWTWARLARIFTGELRLRALRRALRDPVGSARPLVEAAELLPVEMLPRALEMASAMFPSVNFGATALRAVLPAWAAAGNVRDALERARAIPDAGERGATLARLVAHVDEGEREALRAESACASQPALAGAGNAESLTHAASGLPADVVFTRWVEALRMFSQRGEEFLEDDCGWGFVEWCPLTAAIGGDEALREATAAMG